MDGCWVRLPPLDADTGG
jgi:hypothetical protein